MSERVVFENFRHVLGVKLSEKALLGRDRQHFEAGVVYKWHFFKKQMTIFDGLLSVNSVFPMIR